MNTAKDAIVRLTREIVPGMIVIGIEVAEIDGSPRMVNSNTLVFILLVIVEIGSNQNKYVYDGSKQVDLGLI